MLELEAAAKEIDCAVWSEVLPNALSLTSASLQISSVNSHSLMLHTIAMITWYVIQVLSTTLRQTGGWFLSHEMLRLLLYNCWMTALRISCCNYSQTVEFAPSSMHSGKKWVCLSFHPAYQGIVERSQESKKIGIVIWRGLSSKLRVNFIRAHVDCKWHVRNCRAKLLDRVVDGCVTSWICPQDAQHCPNKIFLAVQLLLNAFTLNTNNKVEETFWWRVTFFFIRRK